MATLPHPWQVARAPVRAEAQTIRLLLDYGPIVLVAATFFFMSSSKVALGIGPLGAVIWLGCIGLLMLMKREALGSTLFKWWPLLIAPFMCFVSFTWSTLPDVSLKFGFQFFLTCLVGVFIARALTPRQFAVAMFCGMLVFCLASIASGRMGGSAVGLVLIGLTGSKNAMAFAAHMLLASAVAVLVMPNTARVLRIAAALGALVGSAIVATTESTTAVLLSFGSTAVFLAMCVMQQLKPAARGGLLVAVVVLLWPLLLILPEIRDGFLYLVQDVFHKDPTLTGRTHLWAIAEDLLARRPAFGWGYKAVWYGDSIEALTISRSTGLDGVGFNFHSTYWQMVVDVGIVGLGFFVAGIIAALVGGFRQFMLTPTTATMFIYSFLLVTVAKSFTEVLVAPFSIPTVLLYVTLTYALDPKSHLRDQQNAYA